MELRKQANDEEFNNRHESGVEVTVTTHDHGHALSPDLPTPHASMKISELTEVRRLVAERIVELVMMQPDLYDTPGQLDQVVDTVENETGWGIADIYSALSYSERYLHLKADRLTGRVRVSENDPT